MLVWGLIHLFGFIKKIFILLITFFSVLLALQIILIWFKHAPENVRHLFDADNIAPKVPYPIILWWTPFTGDNGSFHRCGDHTCFFTQDKNFFHHNLTKAIMFYGSDFLPYDLPLPRKHDWALLHEESPKNSFLFSMPEVMELFNHTATFRRSSHFPLTLQYLKSLYNLTSKKYFVPTKRKNELLEVLAPVAYVQSDCDTPSNRDVYIQELMRYVKIDSYGKCLHNKDLPKHLRDPIEGMDNEEFLSLLANYKFVLSFENAVCEDYITEKLWRTLTIGSVPIYYGSPSVQDWLPNPDSAVLVDEFPSPRSLAAYITYLNNNDTVYESKLAHKLTGKVSSRLLIKALNSRTWGVDSEPDTINFIEAFECFVCERVAENFEFEKWDIVPFKYEADVKHYGCPEPISPLTGLPDKKSWWLEMYRNAKVESKVLHLLLQKNEPFDKSAFYSFLENQRQKFL